MWKIQLIFFTELPFTSLQLILRADKIRTTCKQCTKQHRHRVLFHIKTTYLLKTKYIMQSVALPISGITVAMDAQRWN